MGFSASIQSVAKVKNHRASKPAKVEIRKRVLAVIGPEARVFDGYAGAGEMFRNVWHAASYCVGCDLNWHRDGRLAYVADNRRVLRTLNLQDFNIFDFDAFGSPWEQVLILCSRRVVAPGERIGVVLTDGTSLKLKQGGLPNALARIAGMRTNKAAGLSRWQDVLVSRAIRGMAGRMGCRIEARWEARGKSGAQVMYIGLVLRGNEIGDQRGAVEQANTNMLDGPDPTLGQTT